MSIKLIQIAYDDSESPVAQVSGWVPCREPSVNMLEDGDGAGMSIISTSASTATIASVKADIRRRELAGNATPVLVSHVDDLNIRDALLAWAMED